MQKTADEVWQLFNAARQKSTRRWVPGREDEPGAIARVRSELEACSIDPVAGSITVDSAIASVLRVEAGSRAVWFLTKEGKQRLFLDDQTELFGVAWGPDAETGMYADLGLRTDDPVDAFLA